MRKALWILLLSIFITGCGTKNTEVTQEQGKNSNGSGIDAVEMNPSLIKSSPLLYEYIIKNQTKETVVLEFTSSQRFDYSVQAKNGKQVFLFSSAASFLAILGEEEVKPGEEFIYGINLLNLNLSKGEYVLTAWITPKDGKKYTVTKEFTVE
ncbi:MAG: BsuPI-related putative proteinase inhibitor [Bacillota bacterium]